MKTLYLNSNFHWGMFLMSPVDNKSSLVQVVACLATNHYLNQWWYSSLTYIYIYATLGLNELRGYWLHFGHMLGWVGLWGFLWWAPSAKRTNHHGVSSGWSSVWHRSYTGLSSTQYEQIPIILGVWPFWLTPFFFQSITFWRAYG